jgi:RimJ/RimL family protein N-acetyltransferase
MSAQLIVRPFETQAEFYGMIDYFHGASAELLLRMGVDRSKLPAREEWFDQVWRDHHVPENDPARDRFFLAWLLDGAVVGHSSINNITWGERAYAHLHMWRSDVRQNGIGSEFFRRSISLYFTRFDLQVIYVEPHADNPAPNRVLQKLGFTLVKRYRTTPGAVTFEQDVNHYEMRRANWNHYSRG